MKHLRLFENLNKEFWVVTITSTDTSVHIFEDKESAENLRLDIINEDKKEYLEEEYDEIKDYETNIDEALEWHDENIEHTKIKIESNYISPPYNGSKKLQQMKNAKKYNL